MTQQEPEGKHPSQQRPEEAACRKRLQTIRPYPIHRHEKHQPGHDKTPYAEAGHAQKQIRRGGQTAVSPEEKEQRTRHGQPHHVPRLQPVQVRTERHQQQVDRRLQRRPLPDKTVGIVQHNQHPGRQGMDRQADPQS